mmetsp:Transcript_583/g.1557  ORF Transcript_583/g.1557 Transcript_583/m.1557 type:complete len:216 (-) Transcript_583:782-1429(-)
MVAPRSAHSSSKKRSRSRRPTTSMSTVISSKSSTLYGFSRPMAICTRRRWPSDTLFSLQFRSMSSRRIRRSRRSGSTPSTPNIIFPADMSPWSATFLPANAMSRRQVGPRNETSPEDTSCRSWNAGRPSSRTVSCPTMYLPPRIWRRVVFPAPFAPHRMALEPLGSSRLRSSTIVSLVGNAKVKFLTTTALSSTSSHCRMLAMETAWASLAMFAT